MKSELFEFLISWLEKLGVKIVGVSILVLLLFYLMFINYTEPTELGIARNKISGKMWVQETGGWKITKPWVLVSTIDLRPMRVAVVSAGHGYCAKLIQFDPKNWQEFVAVEGFRYYWWANRFSFNFGYNEEYRGMKDIMRGYGFDIKQYSFVKILEEYPQ